MTLLKNIYSKNKAFFHRKMADAQSEDKKRAYMICLSKETSPIIKSRQTGKWFVLPWNDIVELAIANGIDKEDIDATAVEVKEN